MSALSTLVESGVIAVYTCSRFDPGNVLILIPETADRSWRFTAVDAIDQLLNAEYAGSLIIDQYIDAADYPYIFRGNTIEECVKRAEDSLTTYIKNPSRTEIIEGEKEMNKFMLACITISRLEDAGNDAINRASDDTVGWWAYYKMSDL